MKQIHWSITLILVSFSLMGQDTTFFSGYNKKVGLVKTKVIYQTKSKGKEVKRYFVKNDQLALKGALQKKRLNGQVEKYYANGQLYEKSVYVKGRPVDTMERWHSNGQYMGQFVPIGREEQRENGYDVYERIITFYDSLGNMKIKNGIGSAVFKGAIKNYVELGEVSKGIKSGTWKGISDDLEFEEHYEKGKITEGVSIKNGKESRYDVLTESPRFAGGLKRFKQFLANNIRYPSEARQNDIMGKVYVRFIVEEDGSISDPEILKGIGGGCDQEVIRVISLSGNWVPGKYRGQITRMYAIQPVNFSF